MHRITCVLLVALLHACAGVESPSGSVGSGDVASHVDAASDTAVAGLDVSGASARAGGVAILAPDSADPLTERMIATAAATVEAVTGVAPDVHRLPVGSDLSALAALASADGAALVIDAQVVSPAAVGADEVTGLPRDGFRLRVVDAGDATVALCAGGTKLARQYALYEALRRLGVRYYHPEQEWAPRVPPSQLRARLRTPTAVARGGEDHVPDFEHRSYSFHAAHPLEHQEAFSDAAHPIDEAARVNDWIVKNRGDLLRGAGRGVASQESWAQRAAELQALGDLLGLRGATGITLHNQQQGASAAVDPSSAVPVKDQIEALVTERLAASPDAIHFGIHFGPTELTVTPDQETVQWIDWAGKKAKALRPDLPVMINDHTTGSQPTPNYDDLGCPPGTNGEGRGDYYDLAFHTDPSLGVSVHTVMFYPLEGAAPVYNQKTFAHKLCLMQKASAAGRPLTWFPEGSWWLSFDNPIPVYLPLYIATRGRDVELVAPLLASRGGTLIGHRMFNSGHEWGYWQQDYAVGLWHWNVDVSMDAVLGELFDPLCAPDAWPGSCPARDEGIAVLREVMDHQWELLLVRADWKGMAGGLFTYLSGEDPADEMGELAGLTFRPVRVSFSKVRGWSDAQIAAFEAGDLAALAEMESAYLGWVDRLRAVEVEVAEGARPWLWEVIDGLEINGLRARHIRLLYETVIALRAAEQSGEPSQANRAGVGARRLQAKAAMDAAAAVIARREAHYRYPAAQVHGGGDTPETAVPNGTTYPWRVHFKTHAMSYWKNRESQVDLLIQGGVSTDVLRLEPAIAKPGVSLSLAWPPGLDGTVDLGDGSLAGPATATHGYAGSGVWVIAGSVESGDSQIPVSGAVARSDALASTPKGGLTLVAPASSVAQTVIAALSPGFRWAFIPATSDSAGAIALAPDLGGVDFRRVSVASIPAGSAGVATDPITLVVPVPDPSTGEVTLQLTVQGAVLNAATEAGAVVSPISVTGDLVVQDLVAALVVLAGYDDEGALETLGDVLGFDPADKPATVPFEASFALVGE
ncbi:MAG: hypothetical protein AMXMBFR64_19960 [Myxococcales bacterium]